MVFVKQTQKGVADESEVGHQIGIAAAGAVFATKGIAAPVVAIFYSAQWPRMRLIQPSCERSADC
jgi:hypothetical protein